MSKIIEIIKNDLDLDNLSYVEGLERDYSTSYPCDDGCKNDYCRCGVIEDITITIDFEEFFRGRVQGLINDDKLKLKLDDLDMYAIRKLFVLNNFDDSSCFSCEAEGGYYGQEIGSVTHSNSDKLIIDIRNYLSLHTKENKIKYILVKEFGSVPEKFKNINLENVTVDDLITEEEKSSFRKIVDSVRKKVKKGSLK